MFPDKLQRTLEQEHQSYVCSRRVFTEQFEGLRLNH